MILVSGGSWQAALASADLIHHPNNGPVLIAEKGKISGQIQNEIKRLNPTGTSDGTQIMAVGEFDSLQALNSFKIKELKGKNEADLAKEIDKEYADAADEYPKSVIIGSSEEDAELLFAPGCKLDRPHA